MLALEEVFIDELLHEALAQEWSELYLEQGKPPYGRPRGAYQMSELSQYEVVCEKVARRIITDILSDQQIEQLENIRFPILQFHYTAMHVGLFAVRVLIADDRIEICFRVIRTTETKH